MFQCLSGNGNKIKISFVRGFSGPPQFDSQWLPLRAQGGEHSQIVVSHGEVNGEVPRLVDIQLKLLDGANAGFVFKAIGNGERDDDGPTSYGGVIYIYNEQEVVVMVPQWKTNPYMGYAVHTATSPPHI
ncbi:uncharacterized protein LOC127858525 [Dreissena polymorpha]|uniref:uncharacterized protein LOC127858525 n=1 Tax=Dreissena polymorpha TaxID=45954 RepID=UPI002264A5D4|nr:uncharacterized protein LOC127858525 [Dreissena polymorpha]